MHTPADRQLDSFPLIPMPTTLHYCWRNMGKNDRQSKDRHSQSSVRNPPEKPIAESEREKKAHYGYKRQERKGEKRKEKKTVELEHTNAISSIHRSANTERQNNEPDFHPNASHTIFDQE